MIKINELKVEQLKDLLRERELPCSGIKAELAQRLTEAVKSDEILLSTESSEYNSATSDVMADDSAKMLQNQVLANMMKDLISVVQTNMKNQNYVNKNECPSTQSLNNVLQIQNSTVENSNDNISDVASFLPEFNPLVGTSLNSKQFINRIEMLKSTYKWSDKAILFVVQQKLIGSAKLWIDSQEIFVTWEQFKNKFLLVFPCEENAASVHIKLSNSHRLANETPQEYFYKMMAIGNRGCLREEDIAHHIINGINDSDLRKVICKNYQKLNDLLKDINMYCEYNTIKNEHTYNRNRNTDSNGKFKNENRNITNYQYNKESKQKEEKPSARDIECYNCRQKGHISIKCPEAQRKERCVHCNKTNHKSENCYRQRKSETNINVNKIAVKDPNDNFVKMVTVNGNEHSSLIDSGSPISLIRASLVNKMNNVKKCSRPLTGFAGGKYVCTEKVNTSLDIDGRVLNSDLYVVKDELLPEDVLLGRDILCREGNKFVIKGDECWLEADDKINISDGVNPDELSNLKTIISSNRKCFAFNIAELGRCTIAKMTIQLKTDEPICLKPYRIPFAKRAIVSDIVNELLKYEIIRYSNSPYASPVVLVEKKNGESRLCVDYRLLNSKTVKTPFPMPVLEEQFAQLAGNQIFTTLDMKMGYHQLEIEEASKKYTAFVTTDGHYEYNRMPFGLVNAPASFQRMIDQIKREMNRGEILAYLDDLIIPSKTIAENLKLVEKFLKKLGEYGLTLRLDKCSFLQREICYLGHIVNGDGIKPGEQKIRDIKNFKEPTNVTEIRRFLGLTGFFRKFVPDYSLIAKPLTLLTHKTERENFKWEESQQTAFEMLKEKLIHAPVLILYDPNAVHELHTDASAIGLAGILLQSTDGKQYQPVFYFSRHCTEDEQRYHSYELEVLAVVESLERFRIYLLGKHFRLITDCSAIAKVREKKELKSRIARWWMKLLEYDFEPIHRPGSRLAHVDALSRMPDEPSKNVEPAGFVFTIDEDINDWVLTMQLQDKRINHIMAVLSGKLTSPEESQMRADYEICNHRLYRKMAVKSTKTAPVINALSEISGYFGVPKKIITDRGTAFNSNAFDNYCHEHNIRHIKTAVRTPRANGQVERANAVILNYLRTTTDDPKSWDTRLNELQWISNSQVNSTTGFTPNELVFNFKINHVVQNHLVNAIQNDMDPNEDERPPEEKQMIAQENIAKQRQKWKLRFDSKHSTPRKYAENDLVVIRNEPGATGESRKFCTNGSRKF
ncbi:uncharacterized protein LOC133331186 [Musca vetustissima]|uniref:uncharacterized protein LOC133331186 n=1 Tax=Musca vetustissima TaxID=27455 RepID=UPI002AB7EA9E|nr:uncharacterized protein LOC133331186 [Musca vetustissima]